MLTTGPPLTVIVMDALAVLRPLSATDAGMVCVPELRLLVGIVPPVPSDPSRLEGQAVAGGRGGVPGGGGVVVTAGRRETVIGRGAGAVRPPLSVTLAVRVCTPAVSVERVRLPPVPSAPSRLEVQVTAAVRLPSSRSVAVAERVTGVPWTDRAPSAGAVIVTTGGSLTTIVICFWPEKPRRLVAWAVIVCVPER